MCGGGGTLSCLYTKSRFKCRNCTFGENTVDIFLLRYGYFYSYFLHCMCFYTACARLSIDKSVCVSLLLDVRIVHFLWFSIGPVFRCRLALTKRIPFLSTTRSIYKLFSFIYKRIPLNYDARLFDSFWVERRTFLNTFLDTSIYTCI